MPEVKEITDYLKNRTKEDVELIKKAFDFAKKIHGNQKRYSDEPYFNHVFETAKNLAQIGMGSVTISAGLLHDILEDGEVAPEELEKKFGKEILFLVEGVTKLGKIRYRGAKRHNESLRKLFVAMSKDIRVLIIKLSDRLHNMKTLKYVPTHKQERIATETLEIYAPIAYRLGIRKVNRELEDLAFPFVYPEEHRKVYEIMKEKDKENIKHLEKFHKSLKKSLANEGMVNIKTDYRIKGMYSLYKKLLRKKWDIEKIYDISALRIIVPTINDCYKVLGIVHGSWRPLPGRIKDYIAFEKPNGYRSIHTTIFTGDGTIVEVQIKTPDMHNAAEYGIASHISYKENKKNDDYLSWIKYLIPFKKTYYENGNEKSEKNLDLTEVPNWIKDLVEYQKNVKEKDEDFINNLKKDFFEHRIFVFTPKGDVIDLPIESVPIDFAYAVHSDVGNHISGVKINGKFVSLDTKLNNGDIVEIQTKKTSKPTSKWLEFVKTATAKKNIKSFILNNK